MRKMGYLFIYSLSLALILLSLTACQETAPAETTPTAGTAQTRSATGLIHHEGNDPSLIGSLVGTLAIRNNCVRLDVPDFDDENAPPISYLTIWPPDFRLEYTSEAIVVIDDRERFVGGITDAIWIDGGPLEALPPELEAQRPPDCAGPYLYINNASPNIPF